MTIGPFEEYASGVASALRFLLRRRTRIFALATLAAALLVAAPVARGQGSRGEHSLDVTFFANGQISVALPDGTPVGTTSGAPTVIPAGVYTISVLGPGGCTQLPLFDLSGPGVRLQDDMIGAVR